MAGSATDIAVHYLPFAAETFAPVTVDNIEAEATCGFRFEPTADETAQLLDWFAHTGDGDFDGKRVRLKLTGLEAAALYVDADGGLRRGREQPGRLAAEAFGALEVFIEAAARRAGCDPHG